MAAAPQAGEPGKFALPSSLEELTPNDRSTSSAPRIQSVPDALSQQDTGRRRQ
jgi:hypothetical protein